MNCNSLTKYQLVFFRGFILCAIICFSPIKSLAYLTPFVFLFVFFINSFHLLKGLVSLYIIIGFIGLAFLFYNILYSRIVLQNVVLFVLTYSSIIPILFLNSRKLSNPLLLNKILKFCAFLFLFEGLYGIVQAFYGAYFVNNGFDIANGDHVEGTIHPSLKAELALSNPMYAINMTIIGIALLLYFFFFKERNKYILFVGFFAIILSSVLHVLLIAFLVFIFIFLLLRPKFSNKVANNSSIFRKAFLLIATIFIIISPIIFLSTNISLISSFATKTFLGETPKAKITMDVLFTIPEKHSDLVIFGLGPGQFSSRASLMSSGIYFGGVNNPKSIPLLSIKVNPVAENFLIPYLIESQQKKYLGSTGFPHYSWLSIYSELGIFGVLFILFFLLMIILKVLVHMFINKDKKAYVFVFFVILFLLILLGVHENYWEIPQAIFLGCLFLKLLYSLITNKTDESSIHN